MEEGTIKIEVIWRGTKLSVEVETRWTMGELGKKLVEVTNVKPNTLKLLIPQTNTKGSRLFAPFSDDNSSLEIQEAGIIKGVSTQRKPIRMMGVFDDEISEVSQNNTRPDLRIAGFEEEDDRLRQLSSYKPRASLKLPQGPYIFCDFRTLELPGIKLNPPPSKALRMMHILACDPGIIAIMNKHQWRVGIMTELAPVGYVGISPKCILGFNKNHGEEISLRLRTDDLKGFRKYESIKKTLLHELSHMVHSEHDAKFLALEKQLNEEAASLDWSKSRSHTLSGRKVSYNYRDDDVDHLLEVADVGRKVGGGSNSFSTARASSVAAALHRHTSSGTSSLLGFQGRNESLLIDAVDNELDDESLASSSETTMIDEEGCVDSARSCESDNDGSREEVLSIDEHKPLTQSQISGAMKLEPESDDFDLHSGIRREESVHGDGGEVVSLSVVQEDSRPDSDKPLTQSQISGAMKIEPESDDVDLHSGIRRGESVHDDGGEDSISSSDIGSVMAEPDLDCHMRDSDSEELQRIAEPVAAVCARIQESIKLLRSELAPHMAASVFQTLSKIIRNIIEHPDELKFRRIRKANAHFQMNVANYKAAMEVLNIVGFIEDVVVDAVGVAEAYLVLKRNDPGLLWLAKSSLEVFIS